jgi:hypothetical protein
MVFFNRNLLCIGRHLEYMNKLQQKNKFIETVFDLPLIFKVRKSDLLRLHLLVDIKNMNISLFQPNPQEQKRSRIL